MVTRSPELTMATPVRRAIPRVAFASLLSPDTLALLGVLAVAGGVNAWMIARNGYGNIYYAAAVRSMTVSWSNFFFGAFDPGGYITVDKPPLFLWAGAISARTFGYATWSILLPSAIAGTASVGLLWAMVRRYFGLMAATIAALVLALTPISVAVNRLNLPEPFMILLLLGASYATMQSIESRRWWAWTVLAGALVGLAFNTKMMAAWIPGPALALALVVATRSISWASAREIVARLAILLAVTLIISASWMAVVDLWPTSNRPYIGGSTDNTVLDLAINYNGFGRVDGESQAGPGGGNRGPGQFRPPTGTNGQAVPPFNGQIPPGGGVPGAGGAGTAPVGGAGFRGAGGIVAGTPGWTRMFDDANGGQIAWFLPFAIGGALLALWSWRRDPSRRAFVVLFASWVALFGGVFSFAQGIFHSYYTSAMAPGVAALTGIGAVSLVDAVRRDRRWLVALAGLVGITAWVQLDIAGRDTSFYGWVRPITLVVVGGGVALAGTLAMRGRSIAAGVAVALLGLLLLPAAWSASVTANESLNTTLPQAGPQQGASGGTFGSQAFDSGSSSLATWLFAHHDDSTTWDLVVSNSQGASRLIAEYNVSVMSLGGFMGSDDTTTVGKFAGLVADGSVRYVQVGGQGPGGGFRGGAGGTSGTQSVLSAVQSSCTAVTDADLPSTYQGSIYDCSGAAAALNTAGG